MTLYTLDRALYQLSYRGSSAGWAQISHLIVHLMNRLTVHVHVYYQLSYRGSSAGWAQISHLIVHLMNRLTVHVHVYTVHVDRLNFYLSQDSCIYAGVYFYTGLEVYNVHACAHTPTHTHTCTHTRTHTHTHTHAHTHTHTVERIWAVVTIHMSVG